MLSETCLAQNSFLENVENFSFISSPPTINRWGGVEIYIHNSVKYIIKEKSADSIVNNNNIDYIVIQLIENTNIPLAYMLNNVDILNNFFTSVYKQAPKFQADQHHTIPDSNFGLFFSPITPDEIVDVFASISNSRALDNDGLPSEILKSNATLICQQLTYTFIFYTSFLKVTQKICCCPYV